MSAIYVRVDSCQVVSAGPRSYQNKDENGAPVGQLREWHSLELAYEGGKLNVNYEPAENDHLVKLVGQRVSGYLAVRQNKSALYVDKIVKLEPVQTKA